MYSFATNPQQVSVALLDSVAPPTLSQAIRPYEPKEPLLSTPYPPTLDLPEPMQSMHETGRKSGAQYERSSSRMSAGGHDLYGLEGAHGVGASPSRPHTCAAAQQTATVAGAHAFEFCSSVC